MRPRATSAFFFHCPQPVREGWWRRLKQAGLPGPIVRVALEKPLGEDLASASVINDTIASLFPEERTFRIDHYLGKGTVQNLACAALRQYPVRESPGMRATSMHVQITVAAKTVGLEGAPPISTGPARCATWCRIHMMQLLALVAMEPPGQFDAGAVRDEKVKVLQALRPMTGVTARKATASSASMAKAPSAMPGSPLCRGSGQRDPAPRLSSPSRPRSTIGAGRACLFHLRTGKRLAARKTRARHPVQIGAALMFAGRGGKLEANKLRLRLQPEEDVRLSVMAKVPGLDREGMQLEDVALDLSLAIAFGGHRRRIVYERLLLDFVEGDPTLFVRRDEVEAQWAWIDTVKAGWAAAAMKPQTYDSGGWGPDSTFGLTEQNARWHD